MLDEVRQAIDDYFPHAKDMYSNGPYEFHEYPWLDYVGVSPDGREISLLIKFWAGGQFCCKSPVCRFIQAFFRTNWADLRRLLRSRGVEPDDTIRFVVRVELEAGAQFAEAPGIVNTRYTVLAESSWAEYETDEAQPDRAQKIVRSSAQ